MPSRQCKANNRNGRVVWTRDLKLCLHMLYTEFEFSGAKRAQIFNKVFEEYLIDCGLPEGAAVSKLQVQYQERHKPKARDWSSICQPPASAEDSRVRDTIRARIRDALSALSSEGSGRPRAFTRRARSPNEIAPVVDDVVATPPDSTTRSSKFRSAIATAAYDDPSTPTPVTRSSAIVVIPTKPNTAQQRTPPSKSPRSTQHKTPKVAFKRNDGSTIMVCPKSFKGIQTRVRPVPERKAHPPLPALLFRYVSGSSVLGKIC